MVREFLLGFGIWLAAAGLAQAGPNYHVAPDLKNIDRNQRVDVIIQFKSLPGSSKVDKLRAQGGDVKRALPLINGLSLSLPAAALDALSNDADILYISPDRRVNGVLDYGTPAVNANIASVYGWNGIGVGVAVVDSGIAPVGDLEYANSAQSRIVYHENFVEGQTTTQDLYGHGIYVAGILAGNGKNFFGLYRGIATNANLAGSAISPVAVHQSSTGKVSLVLGANVIWRDVYWRTNVVWGDNVVWGGNVVWGDSTALHQAMAVLMQGDPDSQ